MVTYMIFICLVLLNYFSKSLSSKDSRLLKAYIYPNILKINEI